jgi:hypothetical protein
MRGRPLDGEPRAETLGKCALPPGTAFLDLMHRGCNARHVHFHRRSRGAPDGNLALTLTFGCQPFGCRRQMSKHFRTRSVFFGSDCTSVRAWSSNSHRPTPDRNGGMPSTKRRSSTNFASLPALTTKSASTQAPLKRRSFIGGVPQRWPPTCEEPTSEPRQRKAWPKRSLPCSTNWLWLTITRTGNSFKPSRWHSVGFVQDGGPVRNWSAR